MFHFFEKSKYVIFEGPSALFIAGAIKKIKWQWVRWRYCAPSEICAPKFSTVIKCLHVTLKGMKSSVLEIHFECLNGNFLLTKKWCSISCLHDFQWFCHFESSRIVVVFWLCYKIFLCNQYQCYCFCRLKFQPKISK